ncbi:MAG TPA: gliding motility-associated C-terminal domain-containing protein [Bacteroidia bacterium]|nr:gliding motility-associated C-terminal domain-containing protein [Bacteroidia bacterium]
MLYRNRLLLLLGLVLKLLSCADLEAQTTVAGPFARRDVEIPDSGEVRVNAVPNNADGYHWSNGWQTPSIFVADSGWYWVDVQVNDSIIRDSIHFHHGPPCFTLPNSLTPNGELYDCIRLDSECELDSMRFRVFDRWGNLVFTTSKVGDCWNGRQGDRLLSEDTYVYVLEWSIRDGYLRRRSGSIVIIR